MVPDDVLPILYGFGSNGKSLFLSAVSSSIGEYATTVSERVLLANPNDHPTELMTLRGVRLGFIEELPDGKHLPVKRLKDLLGTPRLSARAVHKDNVEWDTTHSLFVTTNYLPIVDEIDHGTWRRLKIVPFPYKFVPHQPAAENERLGDSGLRQRLIDGGDGRPEAMLAWLAEGASAVLNNPSLLREVPNDIETATNAWRLDVDKLAKFMADNIEFDANAWIPAVEMHRQFNYWLEDRGYVKWNDQTFAQRFGGHQDVAVHGVTKLRVTTSRAGMSARTLGSTLNGQAQTNAWIGVKFIDRC
jgi:putative DNA primase/helicase